MPTPSSHFSARPSPRPAMAGRGWPRPISPWAGRPKRSRRRGAPGCRATSANMTSSLLFARFGSQLTAADHDKRVDALLFDKKYSDAYRMLAWSSPARRAAFQARIAMQSRMGDAEQRYQAVIGQVTSDAGLMMDRARYLRDSGYVQACARFVRPVAQLHRQARRSRAVPRHDGAAGKGSCRAIGNGRPPIISAARSTTSSRRARTSASRAMPFATNIRRSSGPRARSRWSG